MTLAISTPISTNMMRMLDGDGRDHARHVAAFGSCPQDDPRHTHAQGGVEDEADEDRGEHLDLG